MNQLLPFVGNLPEEQQREMLQLLDELESAKKREAAVENFLPFVKAMWPAFIEGEHHRIVAKAFERVVRGECKRLIIAMAPRHTKSEFASWLLPSWFLGKFPEKKVIQTAHTAELATGFGRKVRNLVDDEVYQNIFPGTELRADSKAAGRWNTSKNGDYFAIGVGGAVTGKGADLLIIDDPHSEQEAVMARSDPTIFDGVYEWYTSGPRQRLQPGAAIIIVMTRWSMRDLTGRVIKASIERDGTDEWEVIELPAILPSGEPMWPEFWSKKELEALRDELPAYKWQAQYQQQPTSEGSAIIKRDWWREWKAEKPPTCSFVIQSWDTAYTKKDSADFSACTTWGVFTGSDKSGKPEEQIILLDAFNERMEFPELKRRALSLYKEYEPDFVLIETKAAGAPLLTELRQLGVPVTEYHPGRGTTRAPNDKIARVNAVSPIFEAGLVWVPATRWAEQVQEQFAQFPSGEHDDLVDSSVQAMLRFRNGGLVRLPSDQKYDNDQPRRTRAAYY